MLKSLIETIDETCQPERALEFLREFWQMERWFDTPHQRAAAEFARDTLQQAGLSGARLAEYPCDGTSRFQDWIMHMAWDCPRARLALAEGGEVLADREQVPCAVVYWSAPLGAPDRPVVGEVVDADALETITPQAVEGKYVLTSKYAVEMKHMLLDAQPLAIVSDFLGENPAYTEHTTKWCNAWSDGPDGWYFHADDKRLAGFNLSPAAGKKLRRRLAENPALELAGFVESRLYEGSGQCVTAVLEGTDPSAEIWIFGHACEQGAHDNCSGVTVLVEALRLLKELVAAGKLPRPRFSIRAITTEECVGMVAFATLHDDLRRKALAGLNVDAAGNPAPQEMPYVLNFGPLSNPSFAWAVGGLVAQAVEALAGGAWHVRFKRFVPTADDMISDPRCGVASPWLGKGGNSLGYHSSADTLDVIDPAALRFNTVLTASWAYALATLDDRLAGEIVAPAAKWLEENLLGSEGDAEHLRRWAAAGVFRDLARWNISESVYESAAGRYVPPGAPPLPDLPAAGPRYRRTTWGTSTLETLPVERRKGFSRWSSWTAAGLYWTDGRRPLPAVERLVRAETGSLPANGLGPYVERCIEAGLLVEDNSDNSMRT